MGNQYDRTKVRPPLSAAGHRMVVDRIFPDTIVTHVEKPTAGRALVTLRFTPANAHDLAVNLLAAALDKPAAEVRDAIYALYGPILEDH